MRGILRKSFVAVILLCFGLSGCSAVVGQVREIAGNDFQRTIELAEKYGKPNVKQCFSFLVAELNKEDSNLAKIDALLAEDTAGIASSVLKGILLKEAIEALNDPVARKQFEVDFKANCSAVAGDVLFNIMKDSRRVAERRL